MECLGDTRPDSESRVTCRDSSARYYALAIGSRTLKRNKVWLLFLKYQETLRWDWKSCSLRSNLNENEHDPYNPHTNPI